jgi:putative addiction module killer protein
LIEVRKTAAFTRWLDDLRDVRARARVLVRIERLSEGNPGDVRPVGEGVSELRIDYGPDGEKGTQSKDVRNAIRLARELAE